MYKKDYNTDNMARLEEIRFAGFHAEHNLYLVNHSIYLSCTPFLDSKIVQVFNHTRKKQSLLFRLT